MRLHQVGDIDQPHLTQNRAENLMNESIWDRTAALRFIGLFIWQTKTVIKLVNRKEKLANYLTK